MPNEYLNHIRNQSAYPTFRAFIQIIHIIVIIIAAGIAVSGLFISKEAIIPLILLGALIYIAGKIATEVSLMVADTADSTIEKGSRDWKRPTNEINNEKQTAETNQPIPPNQAEQIISVAKPISEQAKSEAMTIIKELEKHGYEGKGFNPTKGTWIISGGGNEFEQTTDQLRSLLKNFK
ncbi:hypothetical protein [Hydrogenophaga defluvii]|uniref:Uncharacterized protein n=1 Tax=Hydrogenophaga defluvii TaxID=249410 RepID=A0ABW2SDN9_9BURK